MIKEASGDPQFAQILEAALLADLKKGAVQGVNSRVDLSIRADDGALIAGLSATTSYGWLRVNMIWVDPRQRRAGHGQHLMQQAFVIAVDRGCHAVWLETSSRDARDFYHSIGFEGFGQLENGVDDMPPTHVRWFLKAALTS